MVCKSIKLKIEAVDSPYLIFISCLFGLLCGFLHITVITNVAELIGKIFVNLLKLVSIPIVFCSVISTLSNMRSIKEAKYLIKKISFYTVFTTLTSAMVGLFLFTIFNPAISVPFPENKASKAFNYLDFLVQIIPSNIIQPFYESNLVGILFLSILFGFAIFTINEESRKEDKKSCLYEFFQSICVVFDKVFFWIMCITPFGIWSFSVLFMKEISQVVHTRELSPYLSSIILANIIQGFVILPLFLTFFKISPIRLFKAMFPALIMAFFTISAVNTLPLALKCAQENINISQKVANFAFPICAVINMNACAIFMLITIMFTMNSYAIYITFVEMGIWLVVAVIAAIGNAGIPMQGYFLISSLLIIMGYPVTILEIILPFYTIIDKLGSTLNIWSNSCVVAVVDKSARKEECLSHERVDTI